jgi:hypothetical protein
MEKVTAGEVNSETAALHKQIEELKARITDLSQPANRKGEMPIEDLPSEQPEIEETPAKNSVIGLREAVKRYVDTKR